MKQHRKTPLALAMGATLLPLAAGVAQAESNPFALTELDSGYLQTAATAPDASGSDKMKDGACGEGKCGAAMMKKDATADKKAIEGKCAGNKPATAPAGDAKKMEGKCGANMK